LDLLRKSRNVHELGLTFKSRSDVHRMLLISDVHFDSVKCDRTRLFKHLKEAQELNAGVFIFGDLFDLMQGRFDPRGNYSELRPEYKSCMYVDEVIQDVGEQLSEYADVIKFLGRGNHETNIEKRMMVSPLDRVAAIMNSHGGQTQVGGYAGWIAIRCRRNKQVQTTNLHYHHGYGGNAKRSKGVLSADIDQKDFPDADFIVRGHDHQKWHLPVMTDRLLPQLLQVVQKPVHHLRLGSYKMLGDRYAGWATEKGFATPRLGGWWIETYMVGDRWEWRVREAQ
jgi:hypothetical protein